MFFSLNAAQEIIRNFCGTYDAIRKVMNVIKLSKVGYNQVNRSL